ncbi:hypothetical protein L3073_13965 [Ancylomarina sp. DW003]|nr:hypothetical protein [Ancylomarina sp. DW003]MDE5423321.1 hypothetical protein [Ancylomarina sp. DW003]
MKLLEYIFYKACKFDDFICRDNEQWSQYYGSIIITLVISHSIFLVQDVFCYFLEPSILDTLNAIYIYVVMAILILTLIYVMHKKRYLQIVEKCENMSKNEKRQYGVFSLLYIVMLIIGTIWINELIRDYNLEGKYINLW